MALLKWDDEEEKKLEDELNPQPRTSIASVQSTWQPSQDTEGAQDSNQQQPQQDNYLMSEEKAMADQQLQQRRADEAAARAEAVRQAEIARENDARARAAEEAAQQAQPEQHYKPKNAAEATGDFFQGLGEGLWKGGAGLIGSGASLVSSLVTGDGENGVTKATRDWQKSADDWGNSVHADGVGEFIGSLPGGIVSGLVDPANYMIRGVRNTPEMLAANIAAGSDDKFTRQAGIDMQKELQDRQFGKDVTEQGDMGMLMEGIAKPGEVILNVLTAGGASVPMKVSEQAYKEVAKTAAKEGIINVAAGVPFSVLEQAARGQEITPESVTKEALVQGAIGTVVGGVSKGRAISKNRNGIRENASILEQDLTPVERAAEDTTTRQNEIEDGNVTFEQPTQPVADGFVTPEPTDAPQFTPVADNLTPVIDEPTPQPLTEAPDQLNGHTPPDWDEVTAREVAAAREQPVPEAAPVADGTVQAPTVARPVENMPVVKADEVRALQDSRAGASQAEEAVINQRLQELKDEAPNYFREDSEIPDINRILKNEDTMTDVRESDIASNPSIQELDNSLETIRQRREQMIADGRSENYHGVKQLDKAADLIIREQEKIANGVRSDEVMADKGTPEWERHRNRALATTERVANSLESGTRVGAGGRIIGTSFAKGYRQNAEALKNASPNKAYEIDPKTGKVREHEASEILSAFSRSIGEDLPPIVLGNTPKQGARRRLDSNTAGANATYSPSFNRLDYKEKRSVYHETVHHIDHFINEYKGDNPKMRELQQLRKEITPEEVRKYKKVDSSADNVYEYVAHAMDLLLDGRLKKGELGAGVLKYVKAFFTEVKEALSSAHVYGRQGIDTVKYIKELDKAIHEIDLQKTPKQKPLSPEDLTPTTSNLPPKMQGKGSVTPVKVPAEPRPKKTVSEWAKRVYSQTDLHKDMKRRLAVALGKEKDAELEIGELLSGTKISGKDKAAITERYQTLEKLSKEFNKLMQGNRKLFKADTPESIRQGISQLDEATSRKANKLIDAYGRAERDLNGYIRKVQGKKSLAHRGVNALQNVTGARNASLLSSVGGIERNISQELGANLLDAVMHPVKYVKGMPQLIPEVLRSYKRAFREYKVKPKTLSEALPYTIGNTYRVLMSPVTGQANYRKSIMRETLAESLLRAEGLNPTRAEIKKFAGSMGADSEVVANNLAGIMNGMTSHTNGLEVMQNYQKFIHTGSAEAKETFMKNAERSSNLAAKLSRVGAESDDPKVRASASLMNIVMPFVTTASNMAKTAVTYNFNPMARSVPDEVMKAVRSNPANALALLKANAVKGGVLAGVYGLYAAGVVQYNNGDEVDKPRGISIDLGNGEFFPVRGTPIEVPIAAVVAAGMLADDVADGKVKNWSYYGGILGNSLPYIDSTNNIVAATISALDSAFGGDADQGTGDNGYAAKSYAVNMAKSFVPYSNNGVQAGVNGWQGKSTNAKSTYDKNMGKWLGDSIHQAYDPAFRDSLKDSRDASGRVRTVDQQGGFRIQKGINDQLTKVHNDTIDNLVKYGRDNGLGRGTQDMFNTYDTGKNNNFKSIQDTITFLDVEAGADGKKSPKAEDKLKDNEKLADLASQIRDGFWGDTGDNLLMLGDQQLYSDASVPNKNGTKNSRLPLNMQSIKNAIAATDLPEDQRDRMYEISQANQALYDRRKAGEITYDQEQAMKAQGEQEYIDILSNSENYKKMGAMMSKLDEQGFFNVGGLGSTKAGQTYLWNSLNTLLGSKGATPAAQWDSGSKSGWGSGGGGGGSRASYKPANRGVEGMKWTPVGKRQMASVKTGKYTPVQIKVKLGNAVKKDKTQNYSDRSF